MAPFEGATGPGKNQEAGRRGRRRPRMRRCLLKRCEQRFHPRSVRQRYCSARCREAARKWSRWKAQQRYRASEPGQQKRKDQSRRYRERVKSRKTPEPKPVNDPARVITQEEFFRSYVRPARLLRALYLRAAKSFATLLFTGLPASAGTRSTAGAALERGARLNPDILIPFNFSRTFSVSDATGVSPTRPAMGAPASPASRTTAAAPGVPG
jgi:hypothetical protein